MGLLLHCRELGRDGEEVRTVQTFGEYLTARTAETLSLSDWKGQKLSPRAEFSRHCLWLSGCILDAFDLLVGFANSKVTKREENEQRIQSDRETTTFMYTFASF